MRVMVTFEHRFIRTRSGEVYTRGTVDYSFLSRYLSVFDEAVILSRIEDVDQIPAAAKRANGSRVSFFAVPYYFGPVQFLKKYWDIKGVVEKAVDAADVFILRLAGPTGTLLWRALIKRDIPYGVEVVADPWDGLAPGSIRTKLRPFLRVMMTRDLAHQCRGASAASYVTEYSLQKRYPPGCWSTHYSSIDLPAEMILDESVVQRRAERIEAKTNAGESLRVCFVGQMSHLHKGQDVLISAVAECIRKGVNLELVILGDGAYRSQLERQAAQLRVVEKIKFLGNVPAGEAVYRQLDLADMFVLPSRVEGLPRALIEAMARGLPCIATNVGGIPELLDSDCLLAPGKVEPLAKKIEKVTSDRSGLREMSLRNLKKARQYSIGILDERRREFYARLANITLGRQLKNS